MTTFNKEAALSLAKAPMTTGSVMTGAGIVRPQGNNYEAQRSNQFLQPQQTTPYFAGAVNSTVISSVFDASVPPAPVRVRSKLGSILHGGQPQLYRHQVLHQQPRFQQEPAAPAIRHREGGRRRSMLQRLQQRREERLNQQFGLNSKPARPAMPAPTRPRVRDRMWKNQNECFDGPTQARPHFKDRMRKTECLGGPVTGPWRSFDISKQNLDKELDQYMNGKDSETASSGGKSDTGTNDEAISKEDLDDELDRYMAEADATYDKYDIILQLESQDERESDSDIDETKEKEDKKEEKKEEKSTEDGVEVDAEDE